ncbi:Tuberous sclerosis 2-like protein, partial [Kickxella alabastrina]
MPFITSLLEQLHLEEDGKVVESVLEMVEIAMNKAGDSQLFHAILGFAAQAAIEPQYTRKIQQQRQNVGSATHHGEASPGQYNFQHSAPSSPPPVAAPVLAPALSPTDSHVSDKSEASYSSFERISITVHCLLAVLEWRITNTAVSNGMDYDRSVPDTIELTERLLDMLESIHTFPSVQRDILSVFTRLHADSMLKLYILPSCNDSVMDQRVSLRENRRLQLDAATKEGGKANPANPECSNISSAASSTQIIQFPIQRYVSILTHLFQTNTDIETYKTLCSGLRVQLGNAYLFKDCRDQIRTLVNYLISFLRMSTYGQDGRTRLSATEKDRMSTLTYSLLIGVMHYKELIQRKQQDSLILAFSEGLILTSTSYATSQICLHALGVGMLEMPGAMMRTLLGILEQLTRIYSSPQISGHLLEFVSSISREHQLYANFHTKDYTTLFAVAINYIQFHNNQRRRESSVSASNDASGSGSAAAPAKSSVQNVALSQYVFIMAYQIIDVFFLSLPTRLKSEVVDHIVMGLLRANYSRTSLDEANAVCLDMILKNYNRSSDEILKLADAVFAEDLGSVVE